MRVVADTRVPVKSRSAHRCAPVTQHDVVADDHVRTDEALAPDLARGLTTAEA